MDPLWASIAELWWIAPVAVGAGTLGFFGLRWQRHLDARRLEYDAARLALHDARSRATDARAAAKLARADLARVQAEQRAAHATPAQVAGARRDLQTAQLEVRAATAAVRVQRGYVGAARAAVPSTTEPAKMPLARLMATHDAITARWLEYETDAARRLMFPAMSDGRVPATAAFLTARAEAEALRPATPTSRMTPAQFVPYRDAVARLSASFDAAEAEAWRQARATGMVGADERGPDSAVPPAGAAWSAIAQQAVNLGAQMLSQAADAAASAMVERSRHTGAGPRDPGSGAPPARPPRPEQTTPPPPPAAPAAPPPSTSPSEPESAPYPVWPVPRRTSAPRG